MSVRIRLARVGKKGHPSYRIVVAEVNAPRDGSYLEWIGQYDPMTNPPAVTLKQDRAAHWLSMGALPTDAVARILDRQGLMERTHTFKNRGHVVAEEATAAAPAAVAVPPADDAPAAEEPADEGPVDEGPVDEAPAEEGASKE
ncbi:MAG: 30S ribosomal protein S16 [SAR202 cluster bacterium Io17-Chloro-G6]|nr:MAG: 30S ribosomal protein S16 [SAR202 cluster bacterium Io17-Chloro-G6]